MKGYLRTWMKFLEISNDQLLSLSPFAPFLLIHFHPFIVLLVYHHFFKIKAYFHTQFNTYTGK